MNSVLFVLICIELEIKVPTKFCHSEDILFIENISLLLELYMIIVFLSIRKILVYLWIEAYFMTTFLDQITFHCVNSFYLAIKDQIYILFFHFFLGKIDALDVLPKINTFKIIILRSWNRIFTICTIHLNLIKNISSS